MPDFNILHPFFEIICSLISNSICRLGLHSEIRILGPAGR